MKLLVLIFTVQILSAVIPWEPDFEKAKQTAKEKNEYILLNFSGSDWCGPCMRMRSEIFDTPAFLSMADSTLVLVNADFPRNKRNQLDKKSRTQNEALADKYNQQGKFPLTLLINADGKVIKTWDGLPDETPVQFSYEVKSACIANK